MSAVVSDLNYQDVSDFRRICLEDIGVDRFRATTYCSGCASSAEIDWPLKPPPFVKDESKTIGQLLGSAGLKMVRFVRYRVGEQAAA